MIEWKNALLPIAAGGHRGMGGALVGLVLLTVLTGCEYRSASQGPRDDRAEHAPDQESWDVRFSVYDAAQPRAMIEAAYMARYEQEDSTYTLLRGSAPEEGGAGRVTAHVFDEHGRPSAVITANRMTYQDEKDRFVARGQVVVETTDGKRLTSEHLTWNEEERKIRTPGFVRIITPSDRVQGYGLEAAEDLSTYRLSNVTGQTTVEDG